MFGCNHKQDAVVVGYLNLDVELYAYVLELSRCEKAAVGGVCLFLIWNFFDGFHGTCFTTKHKHSGRCEYFDFTFCLQQMQYAANSADDDTHI